MTEESYAELNQTLRKQGRAAIAAQAAAEESLEVLRRLEQRLIEGQGTGSSQRERPIEGLLPFIDALDRVAAEGRRLESRPSSWWARPFAGGADAELRGLARAVVLLRSQLDAVVEAWGVVLDREAGIPVDPERHRVVETRPGEGPVGTVLEVVRAGCSIDGQRVREADVVAQGGG